MVFASLVIEAVLGGAYSALVLNDGATGFWRLNEAIGSTTAADSTSNGFTATVSGGVTFGQATLQPDKETGALGNGTTGYLFVADNALLRNNGPFSVEVIIKGSGSADQPLIDKYGTSGGVGFVGYLFHVSSVSAGKVSLWTGNNWITSVSSVNDGNEHHVVGTWDGTNVRIYIDGVLDKTAAPGGGASLGGQHQLEIGRRYNTSVFSSWTWYNAAYYPVALSAAQVLAHYQANTWTDLTADVLQSAVTLSYGIQGSGPTDVVASSGQSAVIMRNDLHDSNPQGYYSPGNASVRTGWKFGVPFRVRFLYNATYYPRFTGKVYTIQPDTGPRGRRQVSVTAYDIMRSLAEADVQEVPIQVDKSESEVITAALDSLPLTEQPVARDLDSGVDVFEYALNNVGSSTKALTVLADAARSAFYMLASTGDGTLIGRSRHTRLTGTSMFSFNGDFTELRVPSDLTKVWNLVKVTAHPKTIDDLPTAVLYAASGEVPSIPPGETVTLWGSFNDPANAQKQIGGTDAITTLVAYPNTDYDYAGNSLDDGTGTDMTSSLSIVATAFASLVKFVITNSASIPVNLIEIGGTGPRLRIRGRGIYDRGAQQYQASSVQPYGTRPLSIDLPYQGSGLVAQSAAEYVEGTYNTLTGRAESLTFVANESDAKMVLALTVEPGDRITVTEPVSGITAAQMLVQSVALSKKENFITCTLGLAPASTQAYWYWGVVGMSEWGVTTFYGF